MTLLAMQRGMRGWLIGAVTPPGADFGPAAAAGLRVYQNNYRASLIACLDESFPHSRDWIGGAAFHEAMVVHIERVPPSSWTLDAYSRDFPETLAALYPGDPEVAEIAWIERALGDAFVAADADPVTPEQIAAADWDRAVLSVSPTLDRAPLTTNAPALWAAMEAGEEPPPVELLPRPGAVLTWRQDQLSRFRAIDGDEDAALLGIRAGRSFAELCAQAVDDHGQDAGIALAGGWLGRWLADGLIVGIAAIEAQAVSNG